MVDHKKVEQAIRLLLEGIGEDPDREGLAETPDRIARMYEEICGGMNEDAILPLVFRTLRNVLLLMLLHVWSFSLHTDSETYIYSSVVYQNNLHSL